MYFYPLFQDFIISANTPHETQGQASHFLCRIFF